MGKSNREKKSYDLLFLNVLSINGWIASVHTFCTFICVFKILTILWYEAQCDLGAMERPITDLHRFYIQIVRYKTSTHKII